MRRSKLASPRARLTVVLGAAAAALLLSCSQERPTGPHVSEPVVALPPAPIVFSGAGDMVKCAKPSKSKKKKPKVNADLLTAALLDTMPGKIFTIGDNVYESGSAAEFANCYDPSWGRFKARTYPTIGNHEYELGNADGYFGYFGAAAGPRDKGYYSFDLGPSWHVIVLNSNTSFVPAKAGSAQEAWLRADLAANTRPCTIALWHHPRFYSNSSSRGGTRGSMKPLWDDLYAANAEIVLNGHSHFYERFAPMDPDGQPDAARGIREFIVGTGGKSISVMSRRRPNSEAFNGAVYGVLRLTLDVDAYHWRFVPVPGAKTYADSGTTRCH